MSLCEAVADGEVERVRDLLARGEDPNKKEEGSTPIACAMSLLSSNTGPGLVRDVFACIKLCLDAGADPNVLWDERVCGTPLGEAVMQGRPEFVRLLLSAGADPNVPADPDGLTILRHACDLGGNRASRDEIVRLLLAAGADHAAQSNTYMGPTRTPFENAVCCGYHRLWPLFLQAGAAIPDIWKRTQARLQERGNLPAQYAWQSPATDLAVAKRYEYLRTVGEAGGFKAYEKAHTRALAATLAKKLPAHIPEEIFPRVVAFWAHAGFYVSAAAVAALPRAAETNPNQED